MKKQKILALILAVFMLTTLIIPVGATGEVKPVAGYDASLVVEKDLKDIPDIKDYATLCPSDGTLKTEFKITDVAGFKVFSDLITNHDNKLNGTAVKQFSTGVGNQWYRGGGITVYLAQDLDFGGEEISPIGGWYHHSTASWVMVPGFSGTFDGQGHTIDNFKITAPAEWSDADDGYIGLFRAFTRGATVKNLTIGSKAVISSNGQRVGSIGALVGVINTNQSNDNISSTTNGYAITIENVCNNATVLTDGDIGGGLVGRVVRAKLIMNHCTNNGEVKPCTTVSDKNTACGVGVGGLIGLVGSASRNGTSINNAAYITYVTIENSVNSGKIDGTEACTGGIVGYRRGHDATTNPDTNLTIDNCVNLGAISSAENNGMDVGGILGRDNGKNGTVVIQNCTNYGALTGGANRNAIIGRKLTADGFTVSVTDTTANKNCAFNDNMVVSHYQTSAEAYTVTGQTGDFYSVRVISMHNNLDAYTSFGYKVTVTYGDNVTKTLKNPLTDNKVYTSLTVDSKTVTPNEYGYGYFSAISIDNIPVANGDITVTVTPIITYAGQSTPVEGIPVTFTVEASTLYAA